MIATTAQSNRTDATFRQVLHNSPRHARDVLAEIHSRIDYRTGVCFPSQLTIARALGVTVRTVQRAVRALKRVGVLQIVRPGTGHKTTVYAIAYPAAAKQPDAAHGKRQARKDRRKQLDAKQKARGKPKPRESILGAYRSWPAYLQMTQDYNLSIGQGVRALELAKAAKPKSLEPFLQAILVNHRSGQRRLPTVYDHEYTDELQAIYHGEHRC